MDSGLKHLSFALLIVMLTCAKAHTTLAYPKPTRQAHCRMGGEGPPNFIMKCPGPCPKVWKSGTSKDNPAATWRRGQRVTIKWHKNNHQGGFVRLTLVPLDKANDKEAHRKGAFWWGCYETGLHKCRNKWDKWECGSDKKGVAFQTQVNIPTNLPDGKYMLGMTWYGGVKWTRKDSYFGDYWSCSHITIRGGAGLSGAWGSAKPVWNGRKCLASVNKLGPCTWEPCLGKRPRMMAPAEFEGPNARSFREDDDDDDDDDDNDDKGQQKNTAGNVFIKGLVVYDAETNRPVGQDFSKKIESRRFRNGFSLAADVAGMTGDIDRVEFYVNGKLVQVEEMRPYTIAGDMNGDVARWNPPARGRVSIKVSVVMNSGRRTERTFMVYL